MKQLFAVVFIAATYSSAFAQTQKGQSIMSGSVGLSYSKATTTTNAGSDALVTNINSYGVSLTLNRGTFFRDNWSINYSLSPTYNRSTITTDPNNRLTNNEGVINSYQAGVGLAIRRYWPVAERLYVYIGGGLSGSASLSQYQSTSRLSTVTYTSENRQTQWAVQPTGQAGLLYTLTNRLALEANAQTSGIPVNVGTVGFGLALLTGNTSPATYPANESAVAPQVQKGRWLVGASAAINGGKQRQQGSTQPVQETSSSTATASLLAGLFIQNNVLLGVEASHSAYRTGNQTGPGTPTTGFSVDAYVRSYLGSSRLRPFVQGGVNYGRPVVNTASNGTAKQVGVVASAGLAYLAGDRFIIQSVLGSVGGTYGWDQDEPTNTSVRAFSIDVSATLTPSFAIYYAL